MSEPLSKGDIHILNVGKTVDRVLTSFVLDLVEYAQHKQPLSLNSRARIIKERLQVDNGKHWQVMILDGAFGKKCSAFNQIFFQIRTSLAYYFLWYTKMDPNQFTTNI